MPELSENIASGVKSIVKIKISTIAKKIDWIL
jgi:hypothetical protein